MLVSTPAAETGLALSLLAVYGIRIGFNEADALILLTVLGVGTVTLQLPLILRSERSERLEGWAADLGLTR